MDGNGINDPRPSRKFIAIGTSDYVDPEYAEVEERKLESDSIHQTVPRSLAEVVAAFSAAPATTTLALPGHLLNPDTEELKNTLAHVADWGDLVVVYYTGHGELFQNDGYYLITADFTKADRLARGIPAAVLPQLLVKRDVDLEVVAEQPPILLILDCCFSGAAGLSILRSSILSGPDRNLWVWATASETQYATSGVFATALADLLRHPNVGPSAEHIPLDTVLRVIDRALKDTGQRAAMFAAGFSTLPEFFPNVDYIPQVAGLTVAEQHWISKARGGGKGAFEVGGGSYLTGLEGRARAARDLIAWIKDPAAGPLAVVTGSPGTGKSALLSLVLLISNPASRAMLTLAPYSRSSLAHAAAAQMPEGVKIFGVHARGLNTDQVAHLVGKGLGRSVTGATGLLESLSDAPPEDALVIVVDAVDEATSPAVLRDSLLVPLASNHQLRLVVGARRHVISPVEASMIIDLDTETYRDPEALREYVRELLGAVHEPGLTTPYQGLSGVPIDEVVTQICARATSTTGGRDGGRAESFLIAQVIALALRARPAPVDTSSKSWTEHLPYGLEEAFEEDLGRLGRRAAVARVLLEALAWAKGPGLPWEIIWVPVAKALAAVQGNFELSVSLSDADVRWLLGRAGSYVVEDRGPGGRSVFRPFHDRLGEYLRDAVGARSEAKAGVPEAITGALIASVGLNSERSWDRAHPYVLTYLAEHAHDAGGGSLSALLNDAAFVCAADTSTLTPLLAGADPRHADIVRAYRRARPLFGADARANAAYLQEANLALGGDPTYLRGAHASPAYTTKWAYSKPSNSLLTLPNQSLFVRSVALGTTASGRSLLASASGDGRVRVWDTDTGDMVGEASTAHTGPVWSVALGALFDGRLLLATAGAEGTVRVLDPETGIPVQALMAGHTGRVTSVAFGAEISGRTMLASGGSDGSIRLWDAETGQPLGAPLAGHVGWVNAVAWGSGQGSGLLASGGSDGTVRVWEPALGSVQREVSTRHSGSVFSVAFGTGSGGRILLASGGEDRMVRLWDVGTGALLHEWAIAGSAPLWSVAFGKGAGNRPLLACDGGSGVDVWDAETGERVGAQLTGHSGWVRSLAFGTGSDGGPLLASAGSDGTTRIWTPETDHHARPAFGQDHGDVWATAFSTGADAVSMLATAGRDRVVRIWDANSGRLLREPLRGHADTVSSLTFGTCADGRPLLASGSYDRTVRVWDGWTGGSLCELSGAHRAEVTSVMFGTAEDGQPLLASASRDSLLVFWDLETGRPLTGSVAEGGDGWIRSLATSVGEQKPLLASVDNRGIVVVRAFENGKEVGRLNTRSSAVTTTVEFLREASGSLRLVTGGIDGLIRLWNLESGDQIGEPLSGHMKRVRSVRACTGAGGRPLIASAGSDRTLRLWDMSTGTELMKIYRRVPTTTLAANGARLAIGDDEGIAVIEIDATSI